MDRAKLQNGQPVRNLQHFLRKISYYYNSVPAVIPDGIFGQQTRSAVMNFQRAFALPVTGVVNHETWQKIVEIYNNVVYTLQRPRLANIFPSADHKVNPGEQHDVMHVIQGLMIALGSIFRNIPKVQPTGVNDEQTTQNVKRLQKIFGLEQTGIVDRAFWDKISSLYEQWIIHKNVQYP